MIFGQETVLSSSTSRLMIQLIARVSQLMYIKPRDQQLTQSNDQMCAKTLLKPSL